MTDPSFMQWLLAAISKASPPKSREQASPVVFQIPNTVQGNRYPPVVQELHNPDTGSHGVVAPAILRFAEEHPETQNRYLPKPDGTYFDVDNQMDQPTRDAIARWGGAPRMPDSRPPPGRR